MRDFIVVENSSRSRTTAANLVLTFYNRTQVTPVLNPTFPLEALRLRQIGDILGAERIYEADIFDVVALVVGKEDPREVLSKTEKELKRLVIVVEDAAKNRINCSLFDHHVDDIIPHLDESRDEPLIVVLHYFKVTRWNGKTSLQSNFDLSKIHINPPLAEVVAFRERLGVAGHGSTSRISRVESQSAASAAGELTQGNVDVIKIEDAIKAREEGSPWIAGRVIALNVGEVDWCYEACVKCGKKVETAPKGRYECSECHFTDETPKYKYKVQVMVYDGTACITILLWDTYVIQLCGKTAEEVKKEDTDELGYPATLDNLIEKRLLFKLKIRANNIEKKDMIYTIAAMSEDEDLVNKYLADENISQSTNTAVEMGGSNSVEVSPVVDNLEADGCDGSIGGLGDDSVSTKTPAKRAASFLSGTSSRVTEGEGDGQFSTNKYSKRVGRKAKVQIIDANEN